MSTKVGPVEITAKEIGEFLEINSSFSFEAKVKLQLTKLKFSVEHSGTYTDPNTKKIRQYDLRARRVQRNKSIFLAVECKNLQSTAPLVLHRLKRLRHESFHDVFFFPHKPKPGSLESVVDSFNIKGVRKSEGFIIRGTGSNCLYPHDEMVGKSMDQISKRDKISAGDAEVFEKMSQSLSSAITLLEEATARPLRQDENHFSVVLPLLVVPDKTLWVIDYNEDGSQSGDIRQVDNSSYWVDRGEVPVTFRGEVDRTRISHMEVCTQTGLERLIEEYFEDHPVNLPKAFGDVGFLTRKATAIQHSVSGAS